MPNTLIFTPSLSLYGPFAALCSGFGRALPASFVRRGMRVKVALEWAPDQGKLLGGAASSRLELPIEPIKDGKPTVIGPQPHYPAPGVFDHARGLEHEFLHHRLDASEFGAMADGCIGPRQRPPGPSACSSPAPPVGTPGSWCQTCRWAGAPVTDVGVHALAQGGARRRRANVQGVGKELIASNASMASK